MMECRQVLVPVREPKCSSELLSNLLQALANSFYNAELDEEIDPHKVWPKLRVKQVDFHSRPLKILIHGAETSEIKSLAYEIGITLILDSSMHFI